MPVIRFKAGERKADVMAPYLQAAAGAGRSQVVAIGCAQEFQLVWTARKRDTDPGGCPQFSFTREQRRVSVFYVYIFDEQMEPGFIKICTYFPYPVKVWVFSELFKITKVGGGRGGYLLPVARVTALRTSSVLRASSPVSASRRSTGVPWARDAAMRSMRRSLPSLN